MVAETVVGALEYLNATGSAIPIQVTVAQAGGQYGINTIISLISIAFILIFVFMRFKGRIYGYASSYLLKKIKGMTGRHILLIKHTEMGMFGGSMIDIQTLEKVIKALTKFKGKAFDLIIHSPGGSVFASMYISRLLKEYPGKIRGVIPIFAMSGGTLLALSCDEIYMTPSSCLGPVDPQLGSFFSVGSARNWNKIWKYKKSKSKDETINFAMMGKQYEKSIKDHINLLLEDKVTNKKERKAFVKLLTSGEVEHAKMLTPKTLSNWLPIGKIRQKIVKLLIKIITNEGLEGVHYE
jgi:ClpP class serine protease